MKHIRQKLLAYVVVVAALPTAQATGTQQDIDQLTQTWLTTEQSTNKLQADWRLERELLRQRIAILQQQNQQLATQISQTNNDADQLTLHRQTLLQQQGEVEQALAEYKQALPKFSHLLKQRIENSPPYLQAQLTQMLASLSTNTPLNKQYQVMVDILKQWHKNDQLMHIKQGLIVVDGQELMTEQLYLGNDHAWFSTPDNSRVGIGFPSQAGWLWQEFSAEQTSDFARSIERATKDAKHLTPGNFIHLPASIRTGE